MDCDGHHSARRGLPIKTSFAWRSSVFPPSDIEIWTTSHEDSILFGADVRQNATPEKLPEILVVFTPGNPGLVNFYELFLGRLFQGLSSKGISSQIICVSHIGHSLKSWGAAYKGYLNPMRAFSEKRRYAELQEQIEYHQDFVEHLSGIFDFKKTRLILIGHGVGAYMATKVMEKHPDLIFQMFGLFPTLSPIGITHIGRYYTLLRWRISIPILAGLQLIISTVFPKFLSMFLITLFTEIVDNTNHEISRSPRNWIRAGIRKVNTVAGALLLDRAGINEIADCDREFINTHVKKISLYDEVTLTPYNLIKASELVLNFDTFMATLVMARSEIKDILEVDRNFIHTHLNKVSFYWTSKNEDPWINEHELDRIVELLRCFESRTVDASKLDTGDSVKGSKIKILDHDIREGLRTETHWERFAEKLLMPSI